MGGEAGKEEVSEEGDLEGGGGAAGGQAVFV